MKNITKRIFGFVVVFILIFTLSGCSDGKVYVNPPMFRVADPDTGAVIYMMGTFHNGYQETVFPQKMYDAIDASDSVAVEVDIVELDKHSDVVAEEMKVYETDDVKQYMGDDYDRIRQYFEELGIFNENFNHYMPTIWTSQLTGKFSLDQGMFSAYGADRAVINYANKQNKEIREFETLRFQYHLQSDQLPEYQMFLLKQAVDTPAEEQKKDIMDMYNAWKNFDEEALEGLMDDYYKDVPEDMMEEHKKVYDAIYTDRQKNMAEKIGEWLKNGEKVFVAVGALHFYAEPDIIDFLTEEGYTVETVE